MPINELASPSSSRQLPATSILEKQWTGMIRVGWGFNRVDDVWKVGRLRILFEYHVKEFDKQFRFVALAYAA